MPDCIFCKIVAGQAPASVIHDEPDVMAFMGIHPTAPGECLVIPKAHVDHFTDLDDVTAQRMMRMAMRIGKRMRIVFTPLRVGMVVHGFGVPHAHLIIVPQDNPNHITSSHFSRVQDGRIAYGLDHIPKPDRATLDEHARLLSKS